MPRSYGPVRCRAGFRRAARPGACRRVPALTRKSKFAAGAVGGFLLLVLLAAMISPAAAVQPAASQACDFPDTSPVYDGTGRCQPGGELVTITQVVDGDEFRLANGRTVRLLGALAPALSECAGPEAAEYARGLVTGGWANLVAAGPANGQGHLRGHLQVNAASEPGALAVSSSGVPYSLDSDLGYTLSMYGWARSSSGATQAYTATIVNNEGSARSLHQGQFSSL